MANHREGFEPHSMADQHEVFRKRVIKTCFTKSESTTKFRKMILK